MGSTSAFALCVRKRNSPKGTLRSAPDCCGAISPASKMATPCLLSRRWKSSLAPSKSRSICFSTTAKSRRKCRTCPTARPQAKSHGAVLERTHASCRSFSVCSDASKKATAACCSTWRRRWRTAKPGGSLHFAFEFQLALVFFEEGTESVGCVEQAHPLLVVKCDREATQPVDAHASLLAYLEFQAALLLWANLVFEFSDASQQFFFAWFWHRDSLPAKCSEQPSGSIGV